MSERCLRFGIPETFANGDNVRGPHGVGVVDDSINVGMFGTGIGRTPWFRTGWVPVRMHDGRDTYYLPAELELL